MGPGPSVAFGVSTRVRGAQAQFGQRRVGACRRSEGLCLSRKPRRRQHVPPVGPHVYGLSGGRRIPPPAGEAQAAGRAPQQVPHPPGRPHGTVVPPQGAAGLLPALAARQVPVGPVHFFRLCPLCSSRAWASEGSAVPGAPVSHTQPGMRPSARAPGAWRW